MKLIATQPDGKLLLSCTPTEYRVLQTLQGVTAERIKLWNPLFSLDDDRYPLDVDEQKLLEAIYEWITTKDIANHLKEVAGQINKLLAVEEK